jgi:hypothetical protein
LHPPSLARRSVNLALGLRDAIARVLQLGRRAHPVAKDALS